MNKIDRIEAALSGKEVDRIPVSAWMHFPKSDTTVDGQTEAIVSFQKKYDWDFIKMMFRSTFLTEDWGCTFKGYHKLLGYWVPDGFAVTEPEGWKKLKKLNPEDGAMGQMLQSVYKTRKEMKDSINILATVFSPYMVAAQLTGWGGEFVKKTMDDHPEILHGALEVITETLIDFVNGCFSRGADGLFFSAFYANTGYMSVEQYNEFCHPYNLRVLNAIRNKSRFNMLHICGNATDYHEKLMFEEFTDYPVDAYNWDDLNAAPSLSEARAITDKCLMGGIEKEGIIRTGKPADVQKEAEDAISAAGSNKFILTPGCVLPIDTPEENLSALRESV